MSITQAELDQLLKAAEEVEKELKTGPAAEQVQEDVEEEEEEEAGEAEKSDEDFLDEELSEKKKRRGRRHTRDGLTEDQQRRMGEANMLYTTKDWDRAIPILVQLVKEAPKVSKPYTTLALIYQDSGRDKQALELFMIAAHLKPNPGESWKDIASSAESAGETQYAEYALARAIKALPEDRELLMRRARFFADQKRHEDAIRDLRMLLAMPQGRRVDLRPSLAAAAAAATAVTAPPSALDMEINREAAFLLATELYATGDLNGAIAVLTGPNARTAADGEAKDGGKGSVLVYDEDASDVTDTMSLTNMLAELLLEKGDHRLVVKVVEDAIAKARPGETMPTQLLVNMGLAKVYLGDRSAVGPLMAQLQDRPAEENCDMMFNAAEVFVAVGGLFDRAIQLFRAIVEVPRYNVPVIWMKEANCHLSMGNVDRAIPLFEKVLEKVPTSIEATNSLALICVNKKDIDKAVAVVDAFLRACENMPEDEDERVSSTEIIRMRHKKAMWLNGAGRYAAFLECALALIEDSKAGKIKELPKSATGRRKKRIADSEAEEKETEEDEMDLEDDDEEDDEELDDGKDQEDGSNVFLTGRARRRRRSKKPKEQTDGHGLHQTSSSDEYEEHTPQKPAEELDDDLDGTLVTPVPPPPTAIPEAPISLDELAAVREAAQRQASQAMEIDFQQAAAPRPSPPHSPPRPPPPPAPELAVIGSSSEACTTTIAAVPAATTHETSVVPAVAPVEGEDGQVLQDRQRREWRRIARKRRCPPGSGQLLPLLTVLGEEVFYDFIFQVVRVLMALKRYEEGLDISNSALQSSKAFGNLAKEFKDQLLKLRQARIFMLTATSNPKQAYEELRQMVSRDVENEVLWNHLNKVLTLSGLYFYDAPQRYLVRLVNIHPHNFPAQVMVANHCLISGNLGLSIAEYSKAIHQRPDDPLVNLCLGVATLMHTMNRRLFDRNQSVTQAFAFLYKYASLRTAQPHAIGATLTQEIKYNLARAHHYLCINHIAEKLYLEVLSDPTPIPGEDLRMEAAFNLSLLYTESGSPHLARHIINTYCVI